MAKGAGFLQVADIRTSRSRVPRHHDCVSPGSAIRAASGPPIQAKQPACGWRRPPGVRALRRKGVSRSPPRGICLPGPGARADVGGEPGFVNGILTGAPKRTQIPLFGAISNPPMQNLLCPWTMAARWIGRWPFPQGGWRAHEQAAVQSGVRACREAAWPPRRCPLRHLRDFQDPVRSWRSGQHPGIDTWRAVSFLDMGNGLIVLPGDGGADRWWPGRPARARAAITRHCRRRRSATYLPRASRLPCAMWRSTRNSHGTRHFGASQARASRGPACQAALVDPRPSPRRPGRHALTSWSAGRAAERRPATPGAAGEPGHGLPGPRHHRRKPGDPGGNGKAAHGGAPGLIRAAPGRVRAPARSCSPARCTGFPGAAPARSSG